MIKKYLRKKRFDNGFSNTTSDSTLHGCYENRTLDNLKIYGNGGKNLVNSNCTSVQANGVTITVNSDKSITLNGENTTSAFNYPVGDNFTVGPGTYTLSNSNEDIINDTFPYFRDTNNNFGSTVSNNATYTFSSNVTISPQIYIPVGTFTEFTIKPMIEFGSTATEYEAHIGSVGELITDTSDEHFASYDIPVRVTGKNLLNIVSFSNTWGGNIAITNNYAVYNGSYDASPRAVDAVYLEYGKTYTISAEYVSGTATNTAIWISVLNSSSVFAIRDAFSIVFPSQLVCSRTFIMQQSSGWFDIMFYGGSSDAVDLTYRFQLEEGSTATEYEPYTETISHICLDEPLRKIGDNTDYLDFAKGKLIKRTVSPATETSVDLPMIRTFYGTNNISCPGLSVAPSEISVLYRSKIKEV